ncbi:MAG: hypothetical protein WBA51_15305 [Erythrobacter sp.]
MRLGGLLLILLAAACAEEPSIIASDNQAGQEDRAALANEIEAKISLPDPRFQVSDYTRYYRMVGNKVEGLYIAQGNDEAVWIESEDQIPMVLDGGCSVFSFSYDPAEGEFGIMACNGVA